MQETKSYTLGSTRIVDFDGLPCIELAGIMTAATVQEMKAHTSASAADDPVVIADWSRVLIASSPAELVAAIMEDGEYAMRKPVALVINPGQALVVREFARLMAARGLSRPVFLARAEAAAWAKRELSLLVAEARFLAQSGA